MKSIIMISHVAVRRSTLPGSGYGVFASKNIKKGEIIERCYVIISRRGGDKALEDFYFDAKGKNAVFLGYGSIYNHSDEPNADYTININRRIATIKALENISNGKEIFISYGDKWFSSRGLKAKNTVKKKSSKTK